MKQHTAEHVREVIIFESLQHKLDRVRPPRVQMTYDVEIGNAIDMKDLPFVVGVFADLSPYKDPEGKPLPTVKDRKIVEIDCDNFNDIMGAINHKLKLHIQDVIKDKETSITINLASIEYVSPMKIVE